MQNLSCLKECNYLVPVSEPEVLRSDVQVGVLRSFGWWWLVSDMFPMLIPKSVRIASSNDESRNRDTMYVNGVLKGFLMGIITRVKAFSIVLKTCVLAQ
jgi:hypothetical protein